MSEPARLRLTRAERRAQIVAAAARVARGRDPATITYDEIAAEAGVSRALIYSYFADRQDILDAVHAPHLEALQRRVAAAMHHTDGHAAAVRGLVRAHLEYARRDPDGYRYGCGLGPSSIVPAGRPGSSLEQPLLELLGGSEQAEEAAHGLLALIATMALRSAITDASDDLDAATTLVAGLVWLGLQDSEQLGLTLVPWWMAPA